MSEIIDFESSGPLENSSPSRGSSGPASHTSTRPLHEIWLPAQPSRHTGTFAAIKRWFGQSVGRWERHGRVNRAIETTAEQTGLPEVFEPPRFSDDNLSSPIVDPGYSDIITRDGFLASLVGSPLGADEHLPPILNLPPRARPDLPGPLLLEPQPTPAPWPYPVISIPDITALRGLDSRPRPDTPLSPFVPDLSRVLPLPIVSAEPARLRGQNRINGLDWVVPDREEKDPSVVDLDDSEESPAKDDPVAAATFLALSPSIPAALPSSSSSASGTIETTSSERLRTIAQLDSQLQCQGEDLDHLSSRQLNTQVRAEVEVSDHLSQHTTSTDSTSSHHLHTTTNTPLNSRVQSDVDDSDRLSQHSTCTKVTSSAVSSTTSSTRPAPVATQPEIVLRRVIIPITRVRPVIPPSDRVLRLRPNPKQEIEMALTKAASKRKATTSEGPSTRKARTQIKVTASTTTAGPSTKKAPTKIVASNVTKTGRVTKAKKTTRASASKAASAAKALQPVATDTEAIPSQTDDTHASDTDSIDSDASSKGAGSKRKAEVTEGPPAKRARGAASTTTDLTTTTNKKGKAPARKTAASKSTTSRAKSTNSKATKEVPIKQPVTEATKAPTKSSTTKRARQDDDDENDAPSPPPKKVRTTAATRAPKPKVVINHAPTQRLDVFVCGEGSSGELGLGNALNVIDVKRPRLNPNLSAREVGVVHIACGGMHAAALTHDNQILTWGVNDQGALGRDTTFVESTEEADESTVGLNPRECVPIAIPHESFPPNTIFIQLACADSATFALTDDGDVYGWGTFRCNEGIMGFSKDVKIQTTPTKMPKLSKITQIACGANHVLALKQNGDVYIWGSGEQNQLGHRVVERRRLDALTPTLLRLTKKCRLIGCGQDHSFAIQKNEDVWTWGLNSFGETGIREGAGGDNAVISYPVKVPSLTLINDTITSIAGGAHHSAATTANGVLLTWGRTDGQQTGLDVAQLPEADIIRDGAGKARILIKPVPVPAASVGTVNMVAIGTDHTISVNNNGEAWSWGFNANYQCGQGTDDDIEVPTHVANTAVRNRVLSWAGAGGQFSIFAAVAED